VCQNVPIGGIAVKYMNNFKLHRKIWSNELNKEIVYKELDRTIDKEHYKVSGVVWGEESLQGIHDWLKDSLMEDTGDTLKQMKHKIYYIGEHVENQLRNNVEIHVGSDISRDIWNKTTHRSLRDHPSLWMNIVIPSLKIFYGKFK
jgi:hypothetical protein